MYYEEFGKRDAPVVVMLHGAFFTDTYRGEYALGQRYHLIVPHIRGFGKAADEIFTADAATEEIKSLIRPCAPVFLVGFSLGAQLAFKLLAEEPALFQKAVVVSPWLVDKDEIPEKMMRGNLKMLAQLKNRMVCQMIGFASGMPKEKRGELAEAMQRVSEQTVRNCVDNGIALRENGPFDGCPVSVLALAGEKESEAVRRSVQAMAAKGAACRCEIWPRAKHNIPMAFAKKLTQTIDAFFRET
ncbi:MAG: alpha/beta hydrolase [Clostridia bacterium]|nr:alpha/beta hydrolase [Clostridia bacterium]